MLNTQISCDILQRLKNWVMEETSVDMVLLCKQGRGRHTAATVSTPLLRGASLALHILLGQTILSSSKHEISVMSGGSTSRRREAVVAAALSARA